MSTFRFMFATLRRDVRGQRHVAAFERARATQPALRGQADVASVLATLADDDPRTLEDRDLLIGALLAERTRVGGPFWQSVLLVAFYPMLSRLRHRIFGDALAPEDLDQLVVMSFLAVVDELPADQDRLAMRLRQRTERKVFRAVRDEQSERRVVCLDELELDGRDGDMWPAMREVTEPGPRNPVDAADAVSLLVERASHLLDGETFELVTATQICGRRIPAYLDRVAPELGPDERRVVYQRIKRRHSRVLARLRPALEQLRRPEAAAGGLCAGEGSDEPEEVTER